MKAFLRKLTTPLGALWLLCHTVMVLLGVVFLASAPLHHLLGQGVTEAIGGALIASGVVGVTLFLYVLTTETLKSRIEAFTKAGLLKIFSGRSVLIRDEYHKRLAQARHIDLVGFGLSAFREDYINDFVGWSHRADVRILLMDPDFPTPSYQMPLDDYYVGLEQAFTGFRKPDFSAERALLGDRYPEITNLFDAFNTHDVVPDTF
jgi:hypothetical protein